MCPYLFLLVLHNAFQQIVFETFIHLTPANWTLFFCSYNILAFHNFTIFEFWSPYSSYCNYTIKEQWYENVINISPTELYAFIFRKLSKKKNNNKKSKYSKTRYIRFLMEEVALAEINQTLVKVSEELILLVQSTSKLIVIKTAVQWQSLWRWVWSHNDALLIHFSMSEMFQRLKILHVNI